MRNIRIIPARCLAALLLGTCIITASMSSVLQTRAAVFGEYTEVDYYVVVNTQEGELNFRTGPGAEYPMAYETPFHNGDVLHIAAETLAASGNPWGMTNGGPDGQTIGWVALGPTLRLDNASTVQEARAEAPVAVEAKKNEKTAVDYYVVVNTPEGVLNMRTGPGAEYPMAAEAFHNGDILHIVTEMTAASGNPWGLTAGGADGLTSGWVAIGLTKKIPGATNLAEAQAELARQSAEKEAARKAAEEKAAAEKAAAQKAAAERAAAQAAAANAQAAGSTQGAADTSEQPQAGTEAVAGTGTQNTSTSSAASQETGKTSLAGDNSFNATPVDRYVEVSSNTGTLAVRQGPGTEYAKVTEERFVNGDIVHITKEAVASNGRKWGYTSISGKEGWVALSLTKNSGKAQTASELAADQVGTKPSASATKTGAADTAESGTATGAAAAVNQDNSADTSSEETKDKSQTGAASLVTATETEVSQAAPKETDTPKETAPASSASDTADPAASAAADNASQTGEAKTQTSEGTAASAGTQEDIQTAEPADQSDVTTEQTTEAEQADPDETGEQTDIPGIDESGEDRDYVPGEEANEEQDEQSRQAAQASGFGTGAAIAIGAGALGTVFGIYYSNVRAARKRRREKQLIEREGRKS